jgi:hypothetical protein
MINNLEYILDIENSSFNLMHSKIESEAGFSK